MYPEQVLACSGFLLLFFNRVAVLVEQLACAFRRLAGDVLHRHALPEIGLVVRRGEIGGDLRIADVQMFLIQKTGHTLFGVSVFYASDGHTLYVNVTALTGTK